MGYSTVSAYRRQTTRASLTGSAYIKVLVLCHILLSAVESYAQATIVVDNPPLWGMNVELDEEMRIGDAEKGLEYTFGEISAVTVLKDGSILVADRQVPVVRKFDPDGEYVGDFGGKGNGPGEYSTIGGIDVHRDNTIGLWDARSRRLTFFDADGEFCIVQQSSQVFLHRGPIRLTVLDTRTSLRAICLPSGRKTAIPRSILFASLRKANPLDVYQFLPEIDKMHLCLAALKAGASRFHTKRSAPSERTDLSS